MSIPFTRSTVVLLTSCVVGSTLFTTSDARAESDPEAVEVAHRLMDAMGGKEAWDAQRILSFRFAVMREEEELSNWLHFWDRTTGQYRLEGETGEGTPLRVLFNVNSKEGEVWLGADKVAPEEAETYLERAYGRFINDTYWFMMPWKWLDPGVHLTYEGEKNLGDRSFDVVKLNFDDGTGLTSQDVYWAYVSKDTGLMERWEYVLQTDDGLPGAKEPTVWEWMDWQELPVGIKVAAPKRRVADGPEVIISTPVHRADSTITDDEMREIMYPAPLVTEGDS